MKRKPSIFHYPIVLKQTREYLAVTCPDLGVTVVEPFPKDGKLSAQFMVRVGITVGKTWAKMAGELKRIEAAKLPYPEPSFIKYATAKHSDWLSVPELAKLSGDSKNTIRRAIDRGDLEAEKSPGGHRSIPVLAAKAYLKEVHGLDWDPYTPKNEKEPLAEP